MSFIGLLSLMLSFSSFAGAGEMDPCQLNGAPRLFYAPLSRHEAMVRNSTLDFSDDHILAGLELNKSRRLKIVCEIKQEVLEKYALIDLKKVRLNIDVDQHLQNCAREELASDNNDRQYFLDRMQKCIAGFQDTHFGGYARVSRPLVVTAILTTDVQGRVFIARQSPLLIARIKAGDETTWQGLEETLAPGNEILKIDGRPAAEAVADLLPYVSSSSPAFARLYATHNLFSRGFRYPQQKTVALEILNAKGERKRIALPWMAQVSPGNYDAQVKFKRLGLPLVNQLQLDYDPVLRKFEKNTENLWTVGYNARNPLFAEQTTLVTYNDDSGKPGLRTGEVVITRHQVFCYLQLLTFNSENFVKDGTTDKQPFMKPLQEFVRTCETKKLPLILDLKQNGGGNGDFPAKLLAILSPVGVHYGGSVAGFQVNPSMLDLLTLEIDPKNTGARNLDKGVDQETLMETFSDAIGRSAKYTDIVNWLDVTADEKVGGYSQKIVAIISPNCISACDMTARLLKNAARATLLGTAANGTGAGYWSSGTLDSDFRDSEGQLKFSIPNFLFGVAAIAGQPLRLQYETNQELLMENRPTAPDVTYELTPQDLSQKNKGLSEAAVNELFREARLL